MIVVIYFVWCNVFEYLLRKFTSFIIVIIEVKNSPFSITRDPLLPREIITNAHIEEIDSLHFLKSFCAYPRAKLFFARKMHSKVVFQHS